MVLPKLPTPNIPYPSFPPSEVLKVAAQYQAKGYSPLVALSKAYTDLTHVWDARKYRSNAKIYGQIVSSMNAEMVSLITKLQKDGVVPTMNQLFQLKRYQALLAQANAQLEAVSAERLSSFLDITNEVITSSTLAADNLLANALYTASGDFARMYPAFTVLPIDVLEQAIKRFKPSGAIGQYFQNTIPAGLAAMTENLYAGLAAGWNPRDVARSAFEGLGQSVTRMETIYRTEMLNVYRDTARFDYMESGAVERYKRISAHDARVCPACLALDGKIYPVTQEMERHPVDRCDMIPIVAGGHDPQWLAGEDWLKEQPEAVQQQILGKGRFQLWKNGDIKLDDLVHTYDHPIWGASLRTNPLKNFLPPGDLLPDVGPSPSGSGFDPSVWKGSPPTTFDTLGEDGDTTRFINDEIQRILNAGNSRYEVAGMLKDEIVQELSRQTGISYDEVNDIIHQWAASSNDTSMRSLAMQEQAAKIFGTDLSPWQKDQIADLMKKKNKLMASGSLDSFSVDDLGRFDYEDLFSIGTRAVMEQQSPLTVLQAEAIANERLRKVLQAMYNHTQAEFKRKGITEVILYRGVNLYPSPFKKGETALLAMNALESWSSRYSTARGFGMTVFKMKIPVERIAGSCVSGYGCLSEWEFVLIGGDLGDIVAVVSVP